MSAVPAPVRLSLAEARDLTEEVKADAAALWAKLLTLYEGEAYSALGYSSWGDYYAEEFGESKSRGYQLLEAARVDRALADSNMLERPATDRVARELTPVLREAPEKVEEVWGEVVELHGPQPTAKQVREVVEDRRGAHVGHNSGDNEWYTPAEYIEAARRVMGTVDLDPASSVVANEKVGASMFYSEADDGRTKDWRGNVWMNPPYAQPFIFEFCAKLAESHQTGDVPQAVALVNNATETGWFQTLAGAASAICFPRGRVRFWHPEKESAPLQGQAVVYLGENVDDFRREFADFGLTVAL